MLNLSAKESNPDEQILKIARAVDEFEGYPFPHALRIAEIANVLARQFHLASHDLYSLRQAALIHDIGEMTMNREYIKANRPLRPDERIDMQRHTVIGEQEAGKRGLNRAVQLLVRWHHEWWNGGGYPDALEREQIPLAARILRVSDTYATLTEGRPYRAPFSAFEARRHLTEWAGIEFDPTIVKVVLSMEGSEELDSYHESAKL
jgi:putative nucleotidyltransferase with HDIG domain